MNKLKAGFQKVLEIGPEPVGEEKGREPEKKYVDELWLKLLINLIELSWPIRFQNYH